MTTKCNIDELILSLEVNSTTLNKIKIYDKIQKCMTNEIVNTSDTVQNDLLQIIKLHLISGNQNLRKTAATTWMLILKQKKCITTDFVRLIHNDKEFSACECLYGFLMKENCLDLEQLLLDCEDDDIAEKILQSVQDNAENISREEFQNFILKNIDTIFKCSDDKIRRRLIKFVLLTMDNDSLMTLPPKKLELIKDTFKNSYLKEIETLRQNNNSIWYDLCIFMLKYCGKLLHTEIELTNGVLRNIEAGFKTRTVEDRMMSYECWKVLIDNCSLDKEYLSSSKQLRLLVKPLKIKLSKHETVICKRIEVWCHLIESLQERCVVCLTDFLESCYGPFTPDCYEEMTTSCELIKNTWSKRTYILMKLIGHYGHYKSCIPTEIFKFPKPVVTAANFSEFDDFIINSICICSEMLLHWEGNVSRKMIVKCLWGSLFNIVQKIDAKAKESVLKDIYQKLKYLLDKSINNQEYFEVIIKSVLEVLTSFKEPVCDIILLNEVIIFPILQLSIPQVDLMTESISPMIDLVRYSTKYYNKLLYFHAACEFLRLHNWKIESGFLVELWFQFADVLSDICRAPRDSFEGFVENVKFFMIWILKCVLSVEEQKKILNKWKLILIEINGLSSSFIDYLLRECDKTVRECPNVIENVVEFLPIFNQLISEEQINKKHAIQLLNLISECLKNPCTPKSKVVPLVQVTQICVDLALASHNSDNNSVPERLFCIIGQFLQTHHVYGILQVLKNYIVKPDSMKLPSSLHKIINELAINSDPSISNEAVSVLVQLEKQEKNEKKYVFIEPKISTRSARIANMATSGKSPKTNILRLLGQNVDTVSPVRVKGSQISKHEPSPRSLKIANAMPKFPQSPKSVRNDDKDFVVIDKEVKLDKSKMSEHQREMLRRRREDIPALYQDLSQSQNSISQDSGSTSQSNDSIKSKTLLDSDSKFQSIINDLKKENKLLEDALKDSELDITNKENDNVSNKTDAKKIGETKGTVIDGGSLKLKNTYQVTEKQNTINDHKKVNKTVVSEMKDTKVNERCKGAINILCQSDSQNVSNDFDKDKILKGEVKDIVINDGNSKLVIINNVNEICNRTNVCVNDLENDIKLVVEKLKDKVVGDGKCEIANKSNEINTELKEDAQKNYVIPRKQTILIEHKTPDGQEKTLGVTDSKNVENFQTESATDDQLLKSTNSNLELNQSSNGDGKLFSVFYLSSYKKNSNSPAEKQQDTDDRNADSKRKLELSVSNKTNNNSKRHHSPGSYQRTPKRRKLSMKHKGEDFHNQTVDFDFQKVKTSGKKSRHRSELAEVNRNLEESKSSRDSKGAKIKKHRRYSDYTNYELPFESRPKIRIRRYSEGNVVLYDFAPISSIELQPQSSKAVRIGSRKKLKQNDSDSANLSVDHIVDSKLRTRREENSDDVKSIEVKPTINDEPVKRKRGRPKRLNLNDKQVDLTTKNKEERDMRTPSPDGKKCKKSFKIIPPTKEESESPEIKLRISITNEEEAKDSTSLASSGCDIIRQLEYEITKIDENLQDNYLKNTEVVSTTSNIFLCDGSEYTEKLNNLESDDITSELYTAKKITKGIVNRRKSTESVIKDIEENITNQIETPNGHKPVHAVTVTDKHDSLTAYNIVKDSKQFNSSLSDNETIRKDDDIIVITFSSDNVSHKNILRNENDFKSELANVSGGERLSDSKIDNDILNKVDACEKLSEHNVKNTETLLIEENSLTINADVSLQQRNENVEQNSSNLSNGINVISDNLVNEKNEMQKNCDNKTDIKEECTIKQPEDKDQSHSNRKLKLRNELKRIQMNIVDADSFVIASSKRRRSRLLAEEQVKIESSKTKKSKGKLKDTVSSSDNENIVAKSKPSYPSLLNLNTSSTLEIDKCKSGQDKLEKTVDETVAETVAEKDTGEADKETIDTTVSNTEIGTNDQLVTRKTSGRKKKLKDEEIIEKIRRRSRSSSRFNLDSLKNTQDSEDIIDCTQDSFESNESMPKKRISSGSHKIKNTSKLSKQLFKHENEEINSEITEIVKNIKEKAQAMSVLDFDTSGNEKLAQERSTDFRNCKPGQKSFCEQTAVEVIPERSTVDIETASLASKDSDIKYFEQSDAKEELEDVLNDSEFNPDVKEEIQDSEVLKEETIDISETKVFIAVLTDDSVHDSLIGLHADTETCDPNESLEIDHLMQENQSQRPNNLITDIDIDMLPVGFDTPKKDNLPSSPIGDDTPVRNSELLTNTLNISPIKTTTYEQTEKSQDLFSSESCEYDDVEILETNEIVVESPEEVDIKHVTCENLLEADPVMSFIKPPSSRSAKLLNLIPNSSVLKTPKSNVQAVQKSCNTRISSPSTDRIRKMMLKFSDKSKKPLIENKLEILEGDILTFTREIPSPLATPNGSILKRKACEVIEEGFSPHPKRKRVNFSDPLSCQKIFFKEQEEYKIHIKKPKKLNIDINSKSKDENTNENNDESFSLISGLNLMKAEPIYPQLINCNCDMREIISLLNNDSLYDQFRSVNVMTVGDLARLNDSQINQMEFLENPRLIKVMDALETFHLTHKACPKENEQITEVIIIDDVEPSTEVENVTSDKERKEAPIFHELVDCSDSIHNILKWFGSIKTAREFKRRNIITVGDLARLSKQEVNELPVKVPKVVYVINALRKYNRKIKKAKIISKQMQDELDEDLTKEKSTSDSDEASLVPTCSIDSEKASSTNIEQIDLECELVLPTVKECSAARNLDLSTDDKISVTPRRQKVNVTSKVLVAVDEYEHIATNNVHNKEMFTPCPNLKVEPCVEEEEEEEEEDVQIIPNMKKMSVSDLIEYISFHYSFLEINDILKELKKEI